ncbi:hypothetical protein HY989_04990 [Candidatus Micrarchaeota archaeon]|nr:hypothetical protein [Candidatus Micrarchaeota archaeon]
MSSRLIFLFLVLLVMLVFTYDLYSYGIELKKTPLLITNPSLVIQAHLKINSDKGFVEANCPDISKFNANSPYNDYAEIPKEAWDKCISELAPNAYVKDSCLEGEIGAQELLTEINSQNELVLGLQKYGVRFTPLPAYRQMEQFADTNPCIRAVKSFSDGNSLALDLSGSKLLHLSRFSEGVTELTNENLLRITGGTVAPEDAFKDYRLSTFIALSGIFIFIILLYSVYMQLTSKNSEE